MIIGRPAQSKQQLIADILRLMFDVSSFTAIFVLRADSP